VDRHNNKLVAAGTVLATSLILNNSVMISLCLSAISSAGAGREWLGQLRWNLAGRSL